MSRLPLRFKPLQIRKWLSPQRMLAKKLWSRRLPPPVQLKTRRSSLKSPTPPMPVVVEVAVPEAVVEAVKAVAVVVVKDVAVAVTASLANPVSLEDQ